MIDRFRYSKPLPREKREVPDFYYSDSSSFGN